MDKGHNLARQTYLISLCNEQNHSVTKALQKTVNVTRIASSVTPMMKKRSVWVR